MSEPVQESLHCRFERGTRGLKEAMFYEADLFPAARFSATVVTSQQFCRRGSYGGSDFQPRLLREPQRENRQLKPYRLTIWPPLAMAICSVMTLPKTLPPLRSTLAARDPFKLIRQKRMAVRHANR
jgi:hypothetical protein